MAELRVTTAIVGDECVFSISGEIDMRRSEKIGDLGVGTLQSQCIRRLTLDMSAVTFIDSTGLAALVRMHQAASAQGKTLSLRNPSERVVSVLRLCALDTLLAIETPSRALRRSGS